MPNSVTVETIDLASQRLAGIVTKTPLEFSERLSEQYQAQVYFKREDLQKIRAYKLRGAYNLMSSLSDAQKVNGVVCASSGNHAQAVAWSAAKLQLKAVIFMPVVTPLQKINKAKKFGKDQIEIRLVGQTYDEACKVALAYCAEAGATFIHPFNDEVVISGQGTVGKEIYDELGDKIDYVFCPVGGGGLIAGVSTYLKTKLPEAKIMGVEPTGCASMAAARKAQQVVTLEKIDTFVDGVAVKTVGDKTFAIAQKNVADIVVVPEGKVCTTMIELYQNEGIVTEPAGALAISALDALGDSIKGKTVVCIVSGGNNDILRYPEIVEKSLVYQGKKQYLLVEFAQKPGQLRKFLDTVLSPTDDIVRFEYMKKTAKEKGTALVGIELAQPEDFKSLLGRLTGVGMTYTVLNSSDPLYGYLI